MTLRYDDPNVGTAADTDFALAQQSVIGPASPHGDFCGSAPETSCFSVA
jgi:hypothetical protein